MKDVLYEVGKFWVCKAQDGFEVYKNVGTHSRRVAIVGYEGATGFELAKGRADYLAGEVS